MPPAEPVPLPAGSSRCRVCAAAAGRVYTQPVLGVPVDYFDCAACGYLQTETPHWLERAYAQPINELDTGIMVRNRQNVGRVVMTLLSLGRVRGRVVDHAGGYGILVRLLRDAGIEARWRDLYCENLVARGFEASAGECDLLTAFEVLEHLVHPVEELGRMLADAGAVLLSTELIATAETPPPDWWYLGREHGQHIGFFRARTLASIAQRLDCHYASDGRSVHLFSRRRIPRTWRALQRIARLWPMAGPLLPDSKTSADSDMLRRTRP